MDPERIKQIYSGKRVKHYDLPISHMFKKYKKKAFGDSSLKVGDRVMVFCCGTGLDFPGILHKIGKEGLITGIDFSPGMLELAEKKIRANGWKNVELMHGDVAEYKYKEGKKYDSGICMLGFSIIPDYLQAFNNLVSFVKDGGEIVVGDMKLAGGRLSAFNPFTIYLAKRFGGSQEGHGNASALYHRMKSELLDVKMKEFFLGSYFYCIGRKPFK